MDQKNYREEAILMCSCGYESHCDEMFMRMAIDEARGGISRGDGGPFGCVIVKDGAVVGRGHNRVVRDNDPTCHGEIAAIRDACANLRTFDLSGCELYTTGEPCTMCLAACLWAKVSAVRFGCTIDDNSAIGFRDGALDRVFTGREKLGSFMRQVGREECLALFREYAAMGATKY